MDTDAIVAAEADQIANSPLLSVDQLPDIDLYIEQMTSYIEERMGDSLRTGDEKIITKPMVNNYTKGGLLPRPKNRRYGREHLIPLLFICIMKQSLSVSEIKTALSLRPTAKEQKETYAHFVALANNYRAVFSRNQEERISRIRDAVGEDCTEEELALLYVTLTSLESAADKLVCSRILKGLQENSSSGSNTRSKERKKSAPAD